MPAGATNYDWAKLVLLSASWPMTDSNVTVIVRWMRQENYVDSWWNRNNPLNNGWGSGGGGGTGSHDSLVSAARERRRGAARERRLRRDRRGGSPPARRPPMIEAAIWASPWATGHYDNGAHWSYADVPGHPGSRRRLVALWWALGDSNPGIHGVNVAL